MVITASSSLEPSFPFQTNTADPGDERNGETSQAITVLLSGWNEKDAMLENCRVVENIGV